MQEKVFLADSHLSSISENHGLETLSEGDQRIYSVGISTGGAAEMRMAAADPKRRIIATTIDLDGAAFMRKQIEKRGLARQIDVKIEDVSKPLPYPNASFDFIYARLVLHYLPKRELAQALGELYRILKRGGKIFIVVRSVECPEACGKNAVFDPHTGMTRYTSNHGSFSRYFHSEESIQEYLRSSQFQIKYATSYEEQLCIDFQRTEPASQLDVLIETLAIK